MQNTLTSQKEENRVITRELNKPQMMVNLVQANETWLLWGRGTGKTVGGLAPWMARVAESMPGHLSGIFGKTFEHLDNNIMPKLLLGLQEAGYVRDQHYVVGTKPPKDWRPCLYPIKKWDRTLTWYTGTTFQQVSLYEKGSANAFDFQSGVFDEAKFMDQLQLEDEVFPTFRGFEHIFGDSPDYLAKIFATDKYADYLDIKWILDKRKQVDPRRVELVVQLRLALSRIDEELINQQLVVSQKEAFLQKRSQILTRLKTLCKDMVYVSEASALDNMRNLGEKWFLDKKRTMGKYEFDVAILNKDPRKAANGFYPALDEHHLYQDAAGLDYNPGMPMMIAMDYQHSISPMCVVQPQLWDSKPSINFINEFYALHPQGLEDVVDAFCAHYLHHKHKLIYYIYDHTAIGERSSAKPLKQIVVDRFRAKGWAVYEVYLGQAPAHFTKYEKIKAWMEEKDSKARTIRFNEAKCEYSLLSMQGAGTVISNGKTQKDKKYELTHRYPTVDQRTTTHFSDVVDQLLWYFYTMAGAQGGNTAGSGAQFR